jgi:V/A-type H+-transporting ATPase subunit I
MIVKLHKYLICGSRYDCDKFFELAQRAGFLEFLGLAHKKALELPNDVKTILAGIRVAKKHEIHPAEAPHVPSDPVEFAERLIGLEAAHEHLLEEERILLAEISRIAVFGDFKPEDLSLVEQEAKRVLQFFCMKSSLARALPLPPEMMFVGTDYDLDYFVSINKERTQYPKMIEITIDRPVGALRQRLLEAREELAAIESDIREYSNGLPRLQAGLIERLNQYHLELAKHDASSQVGGALFAIEAWVPATKIKALMGLLSGLNIFAEEIAVEERDRIPTCMENRGVARLGEDLVHVYDTPSHTDKDPSSWVMTFFTIFFAMIICDAGYGLIYLLFGLFLKWKFPQLAGAGKRFIKMVLIVSSACVLWGVMAGSFFGIEIGPNHPYRKYSLMHFLCQKKAAYHLAARDSVYQEYVAHYPNAAEATDGHDFLVRVDTVKGNKHDYEALNTFYDNILMELSILVGVIHLSLSFLRYLARNWAGFGWIVFMIGGYLFFPKILDCTTMINFMGLVSKSTAFLWGEQMVYGGIGLAFVAAFLQRRWGAFHELMNVVQVFADVLSYLRLYALALAGVIMAGTFNQIGVNLGLFAGALAVLLGHMSNIVVSIMGGVIHGLRLNFLEWYHYSFEGGGRLFNPLKLRK